MTGRTSSSSASSSYPSKAMDGLPPKFVSAMRTLFDILDENKSGYIFLSDIEIYMKQDREEGGSVPLGVVESLRKVTPISGQLSFERFCAGLKICLLRNQAEKNRLDTSESNDNQSEPDDNAGRVAILKNQRMKTNQSQSPLLTQPPGHSLSSGPPKPPRYPIPEFDRRLGDGGTASDGELGRSEQNGQAKKQTRRRESHSRRHTLQNGIDYGLLKRMKAIEEERDALMRGLQTVQRAEEWYEEQLAAVQERMRNIGKTGSTRPDTEITREKLVFQMARIQEVNHHLNSLITADMSFPLSMNLALGGRTSNMPQRDPREMERQISRLKDQNKMLTEEVGKKSTAITVLDQEKGALIRELFQARSKLRQAEMGDGEATFM